MKIKFFSEYTVNIGIFLIYYLLFFLLFVRLPIHGCFTGNSDVVGCLALFQEDIERISAFLKGSTFNSSYFPTNGLAEYTEPYYGQLLIVLLYRALGADNLWAQNLLQVTSFSLSAFGFYYLIKTLMGANITLPFLAGIMFGASTFAFSNIDLYNGNCYFTCFVGLAFLHKFIQTNEQSFLILSGCLVSISIYFSGYVFLYSHFIFIYFFLLHFKSLFQPKQIRSIIIALSCYLAILTPYLIIYVFHQQLVDSVSPLDAIQNHELLLSIQLKDMLRSYPQNLIYTNRWVDNITGGNVSMYHGNLGITIYLLCLMGLSFKVLEKKQKIMFVAIGVTALLLSFGQHIDLCGTRIKLPTAYFYDNNFIRSYVRIPGRIYGVYCFAIFTIASFGLKYLYDKNKYYPLIATLFFLVENVPYEFNATDAQPILNPDSKYITILSESGPKTRVMDLPSSLPQKEIVTVNGLNQFTREYRYSYWQTLYSKSCINGTSGVWPLLRLANDSLMSKLPDNEALRLLAMRNQLTHVVLHKDLFIFKGEMNLQPFLDSSKSVDKIYESSTVTLYEILK